MNEGMSALTKERITKWKNSLSEGRSKQIMKRMNARVHDSEAWLLHRWACITWEEFRNFFDANAACESRSGPRKVRAERVSLDIARWDHGFQCFGSILAVRRRNIACIAVRYYESLLTDWSPVEGVSTTFRDRAPHPRKQRPYFGDPRSHMTRKKHAVSRPTTFSPLNYHVPERLLFSTAPARGMMTTCIDMLMTWLKDCPWSQYSQKTTFCATLTLRFATSSCNPAFQERPNITHAWLHAAVPMLLVTAACKPE